MFKVRQDVATAILASFAMVTLGAVWVSSHLGFRHKAHQVLEWDHHRYIALARPADERLDLPEAREAPFLWRVLVPMIVERLTRLGLHIHTAFYLLTTVSLVGFLITLHHYLRISGHSTEEALLGVLLAGFLPGVMRWYQYQYWMADPLCLFLMMGALVAIERRFDAGTVGLSILGVLTRETFVLVMVFAVLKRFEETGARAALRLALVLLPGPLLVLLALRTFLLPSPPPPDLSALIAEGVAFRLDNLFHGQLYLMTLGSFGILFVIPLLTLRAFVRAAIRRPSVSVFVLGCYASLLLANNTDRLLAYAVPVVLPVVLTCLRELAAESRVSWTGFAAFALGVQVVVFAATPYGGIVGFSVRQPTNWFVIVAALLFAVFAAASRVPGKDQRFSHQVDG